MKPVWLTCTPRDDVLMGEPKEEIFAARLHDVISGTAPRIYQDPKTFFDNTYPTEGLKTLLWEALGRLTGKEPTASSIIRLETAFGGGKTHNLIGLYHICHGPVKPGWVERFVAPDLLPETPIRIAGIVGSDLDPANGLKHGDIRTFTIWGELAYQLKGEEGFALVVQSDRDRVNPGAVTLGKLVGDEPTLILLDELGEYLKVADDIRLVKGTLADQTVAFLMSLLEMAASKKQVVVVFTLTTQQDAFSDQTERILRTLSVRALGIAIPQLGKGKFSIEQEMSAEFGENEQFTVSFQGTWNRYRRLKSVTDQFSQEAQSLFVRTTLRAEFPEGLPVGGPQFQTIRDIIAQLIKGKILLEAEPMEK